jgi:predicted RNase H-like HicB family nuclease
MKYIAFIYTDEHDDGYNALVPDLEGCFSYGETFKEAVEMIKEAAELYCEDLTSLPKASTLEELMQRDDLDLEPNAVPQFIDIKI